MGIKGLTDRGPSLPQIGELRKGGEKPAAGNKPGADLKYFRFTSKHPQVERAFYDSYPDNPTAVNVYFPFQTADENFSAWVEEWGAGSLKWRGDGETLVLWQKPDGSYSQEPKPQPATGGKEIGRLKIVIPELKRLAYVTALTSSINDIMEMPGILEAYEAMRGDLRGIPFVLSRVPKMVSTPGADGKRVRREKWLWHLEAQPAWVQAQLSVMQRAALPTGAALLNNGDIADIETGEILDDDYDDDPAVVIVTSPEPEPPAETAPEPESYNWREAALNAETPDGFCLAYYQLTKQSGVFDNVTAVQKAFTHFFGTAVDPNHTRHYMSALDTYVNVLADGGTVKAAKLAAGTVFETGVASVPF